MAEFTLNEEKIKKKKKMKSKKFLQFQLSWDFRPSFAKTLLLLLQNSPADER